jgi:hypothetical protein
VRSPGLVAVRWRAGSGPAGGGWPPALLAQPGGRYAVEQVTAGGHHHLVPVTPGMFDDASGLVQVTGTSLAVGDHVVVPAP